MMSCSRMSWMRGSTSARVGRRDTRPSGGSPPSAFEIVGRGRRVLLEVEPHQLQGPRPILQPHHVAGPQQHTGNVAGVAVDLDLAVADQLAGAGPVGGPAEPMHHVVQAPLHDGQQLLAGVLRRARGQLEIAAELSFQEAVEALQLLLLAEANAVLARLAAAVAVHTGGHVAPVDGALGAFAARPLQEELHALAPAQLANGVGRCVPWVPCPSSLMFSRDPKGSAWAGALPFGSRLNGI